MIVIPSASSSSTPSTTSTPLPPISSPIPLPILVIAVILISDGFLAGLLFFLLAFLFFLFVLLSALLITFFIIVLVFGARVFLLRAFFGFCGLLVFWMIGWFLFLIVTVIPIFTSLFLHDCLSFRFPHGHKLNLLSPTILLMSLMHGPNPPRPLHITITLHKMQLLHLPIILATSIGRILLLFLIIFEHGPPLVVDQIIVFVFVFDYHF